MPRTPKISSQAVTATGKSPAARPTMATGSLVATSTSTRQFSRSVSEPIARRHSVPSRCWRADERRDVGVEQAVGLAALDLGEPRAGGEREQHDREPDPQRAQRRAEHEHGGDRRADDAERQAQDQVLERLDRTAEAAAEVDRIGAGRGGGGHGPLPTLHVAGGGERLHLERRVLAGGHAAHAAPALVGLGVDAVAARAARAPRPSPGASAAAGAEARRQRPRGRRRRRCGSGG